MRKITKKHASHKQIVICVQHEHSDAAKTPGYKNIRTQETGRDETQPLACTLMGYRSF